MQHVIEPVLGRHPERVSISNSEIQTFKQCRRKWWLGNYRGLQPKEENFSGPLPLGTRVHNALEAHYRDGVNVVEEYTRLQNADNIRFTQSEKATFPAEVKKFESESELGRIMVEGYAEWEAENNSDVAFEVIGAEKKLSHVLESQPRVEIIGKVDLRVRRRSDGSRAVLDHKTTKSFDDYYRHSHASEQLMTYTNLERLNPDEDSKVDGGIYNLLKKVKRSGTAKPPFYDRIDVRFNKKQLDSQWIRLQGTVAQMMEVRDALDNGADHRLVAYPTPEMSWRCTTTGCPFANICTWFDDGSAAEDFLEDHFRVGNPNERYGSDDEVDTV
jgi:CRISPR/Cas system-associated exonuclease Cas4 (RecB family)